MDAAASPKPEFRTIAHSGGKVTITVSLDPATGRKMYQLQWEHCRPNAAGIFAVYALSPGIVVEQLRLGGIGSPTQPPSIPGCYQVFIGSDSEGLYGHQCPQCNNYWRSEFAQFCPYCGLRASVCDFMSSAKSSTIFHREPLPLRQLQRRLRRSHNGALFSYDSNRLRKREVNSHLRRLLLRGTGRFPVGDNLPLAPDNTFKLLLLLRFLFPSQQLIQHIA